MNHIYNVVILKFYLCVEEWILLLILIFIFLRYIRSTTLGCKDIGIRQFEFVAQNSISFKYKIYYHVISAIYAMLYSLVCISVQYPVSASLLPQATIIHKAIKIIYKPGRPSRHQAFRLQPHLYILCNSEYEYFKVFKHFYN